MVNQKQKQISVIVCSHIASPFSGIILCKILTQDPICLSSSVMPTRCQLQLRHQCHVSDTKSYHVSRAAQVPHQAIHSKPSKFKAFTFSLREGIRYIMTQVAQTNCRPVYFVEQTYWLYELTNGLGHLSHNISNTFRCLLNHFTCMVQTNYTFFFLDRETNADSNSLKRQPVDLENRFNGQRLMCTYPSPIMM